MTKRIYKYPIKLSDETMTLWLPRGAEVVSVGMQAGTICLWAIADDDPTHEDQRFFTIRGTGYLMPEATDQTTVKYLGRVDDPDGFVWHVLEITHHD